MNTEEEAQRVVDREALKYLRLATKERADMDQRERERIAAIAEAKRRAEVAWQKELLMIRAAKVFQDRGLGQLPSHFNDSFTPVWK